MNPPKMDGAQALIKTLADLGIEDVDTVATAAVRDRLAAGGTRGPTAESVRSVDSG